RPKLPRARRRPQRARHRRSLRLPEAPPHDRRAAPHAPRGPQVELLRPLQRPMGRPHHRRRRRLGPRAARADGRGRVSFPFLGTEAVTGAPVRPFADPAQAPPAPARPSTTPASSCNEANGSHGRDPDRGGGGDGGLTGSRASSPAQSPTAAPRDTERKAPAQSAAPRRQAASATPLECVRWSRRPPDRAKGDLYAPSDSTNEQ